jgi:C_GCAxxG_C_C family probable redox protein
MNKIERAVACFEEGFSCTQAVLSTYCSESGLSHDIALKIAGGFGGGMGRMGKTCGAVTGAFMVLGLKYGGTEAADKDKKEKTYTLVREFTNEFKSRNGYIGCNELLGYDISTPDGRRLVQEKGLFSTLCPKLVRDAAEILEQLL